MAEQRSIADERLARLPIFPLAEVHLFPGTLLPLHIFEPRYVALLEDALDADRALGMATLDPSQPALDPERPAVHPVLGAGVVVAARPTGDGRWNIILRGTDRLEIQEELPALAPYRQVRARRLRDRPVPADHPLYQRLRQMVSGLSMRAPEAEKALSLLLAQAEGPAALTDLLAAHAVGDPALRQRLLACTEVAERLAWCCDHVGRLLLEVSDPGDARYAH